MKIIYLDNKNIDKVRWDECIKNAPNGNIYAYSWYLDIVSKDWNALVTEDYANVFPLTWRKKIGIKYLCQPPFSQQLGLFSKEAINADVFYSFLKNIPSDYKLIEINLNIFNKDIPTHYSQKKNTTYELDLSSPYDEILKNYSENTKRNIKKSLKNNVFLTENVKPEAMINLFRNNRGRNITTLNEDDYILLKMIINQSIEKKCGELWGTFNGNNEMSAAAFFIKSNGKAVFLFSALNENGKNNGAMFCIIDNFIRLNAEKPFILDFEGSNDENISRFYKGFGSKKYLYFQLNSNNLPYLVNHFLKVYKKLKNK